MVVVVRLKRKSGVFTLFRSMVQTMSVSTADIILLDCSDSEEEPDSGSDLVGFVIPDEDVEECVDLNPEEDEKSIVEQYEKVKDMGTQVIEGRRRSTRVRKATEYYRDPDYENVMFSSGDELSDMDDAGDEDSGVEFCVDDYASDDSQ